MRVKKFFFVVVMCVLSYNASYAADNLVLQKMFDDDQAARDTDNINWKILNLQDAQRRVKLAELLKNGSLKTGRDYYNAAFIEQHGQKPEDFLRAHCLAVTALILGYKPARWISAATLDRYLNFIGQAQIYGTQSSGKVPKNPAAEMIMSQEPYDRAVLTDDVRRASGVPSIKEQERNMKAGIYHQSLDD